MKKLFLIIPVLLFSLAANASIPELNVSSPLTLTAATEGFSQSDNAKALEDDEWINWPGGTIQDGYAMWRVNVTEPAIYNVTLDMKSTNTYEYRVRIINPSTEEVLAESLSEHADRGDYANATLNAGSLNIVAQEPGEYAIVVTNIIKWSSGKLRGVTLSYGGGALVDIPETLLPEDVILSDSAGVVAGTPDTINFKVRGSHKYNSTEWAKWRIHSTGGFYAFTVNANNSKAGTSHKYTISVFEPENEATPLLEATSSSSSAAGDYAYTTASVELPAGEYIVKVLNPTSWSVGNLVNVVASYKGGATIAVPATLFPADAILSTRAWVDNTGEVDSILFTPRGSESYNDQEWAKWKVNVTKAGLYNFKANTYRADGGQKYEITLLNSDESAELISNTNTSMSSGNASISTGEVDLPVGTYIIKVRNTYNWAKSRLLSVEATYEGGAVIKVPAEELVGAEAILRTSGSKKMLRLTNGDLKSNDNSSPLTEYAVWNINATLASLPFEVRLNVVADPEKASQSSHNYSVSLYSDLDAEPIATVSEASQNNNTGTLVLPSTLTFAETGEYFIKLVNQTQWSSAILHSIEIAYLGGLTIDIPATLLPADALLSDSAGVVGDKIDFKVRGSHKYNTAEWAKWKIHVDEEGSYVFTANVQSTTGQYYNLSILDATESEVLGEIIQTSDIGSGSKSFSTDNIPLLVGDYVVKIQNTYTWSDGGIVSIAAEQATPLILSETAADNSLIVANLGEVSDIQLTRSLTAGMQNTICLPFAVSATEVSRVFGNASINEMSAAIVEGTVLNLSLNEVDEMEAGKPYLVRPATDIVNPKFIGATISLTEPVDVTGTNADFVGTFVASTILASPDNLFLAANNMLYFPTADIPIKGMRAYFRVHDAPAGVQMARFVERTMPTDVEAVAAQPAECSKTIQNGQLIITRDGVQYNALGQRIDK